MERFKAVARRHGGLVLSIVILLILYVRTYVEHIQFAWDPWRFNDDQRNFVFAFYRYIEPEAWKNDYVGDYMLALVPLGYEFVYWVGAHLADPEITSETIPYVCVFLTVVGVFVATRKLTGLIGATWAAALVLGASVYLERTAGGQARAFGFPIMAWVLVAVVYGRIWALAVLTVIGAAFYATVGVVSGLMLTLLLLMRSGDRGEAADWSLEKRAVCVGLTLLASALMLLPVFVSSSAYGGRVLPSEFNEYPEAGPLGTHGPEDRPPYAGFFEVLPREVYRGLLGDGAPRWKWWRSRIKAHEKTWMDLIFLGALIGAVLLARTRPEVRRLFVYFVAVVIAHAVARALAPYLYAPSRFITYTIPPWAAVLVPLGAVGIVSAFGRREKWLVPTALVALATLMLLSLGGRGDPTRGLPVVINHPHRSIYEKIAALPPGTMVAGWPDEPMSHLPLVSRRPALMFGEAHFGLHKGYLEEVRRRLGVFMRAYFATSVGPLIELQEKYGVTHILLTLSHLRGTAPRYMPPAGHEAARAVQAARGKTYELLRQLDNAAVIQAGGFALIDLSKLER